MSPMTVADPVSRSYSRRTALMSSSVCCRISSQIGVIAAAKFALCQLSNLTFISGSGIAGV
jgi:hypothetical protein